LGEVPDDDDDSELSLESEDEGEKGEEPRIPKSRLDKQRRKFEKQIGTLKEKLEKAAKPSEVEVYFLKLYGGFKDPLKASMTDKRFMDSLEKLKENPDVQKAIAVISADLEGKPLPDTSKSVTPGREEAKQPASDPRVDKLLSQEKNRRIDQFLRDASVNPKGRYWKGMRKEMRSRIAGVDDIDDLSDSRLVDVANESLEELGWTAQEVQEQKRPSKRKEPPTGSVRSAARARSTEKKGDKGEKPEGPKTVRQWEEEGRSVLDQFAQRAS
jgi:hypothetical protein